MVSSRGDAYTSPFMATAGSASRRAVIALLVLGAPATAAADTTVLGFWFGPRVYSDDARLGYLGDDAPADTDLENSIAFGVRIARPFFPWLIPEFELAVAPTQSTNEGMAAVADVFWMEPRIQLRFDLLPGKRIVPFVLVGGGAPITLSSARQSFRTDITGEGYFGGGVRVQTFRGFAFRLDARVSFQPGVETVVTPEIDVGVGLELQFGDKPKRPGTGRIVKPTVLDADADGIADAADACPDRAEDADGFDDLDGCPDIDNDLDRVLDIADRCISVPESYNGFEDDDGCPDTVPAEVDALRGTVEGLIYGDGETVVRDSATPHLQKIAALLAKYPSIKVVLIGHTDDQEAKQFAEQVEGQPAPDLDALSADLSRARAESVRQALVAAGAAANKVEVEGRGSEEPVAENDKPRGRLANRRVEIKLYVPPSGR